MNAILKYPGAKWRIAPEIIKRMPEHHTYCEPFAGSLAVLFSKNPSKIETVNDLDSNVVNLFDVVRTRADDLVKAVMLTPFAREEYDRTFGQTSDEPIEKARLFLVKCWQGHGYRTKGYKVGWKNDVYGREAAYAMRDWYRLPGRIAETVERLREVQIEHMDALDLIGRYNHDNVLLYVDPPYVLGTRTGEIYHHEMTDTQHEQLLKLLLQHTGTVMVSGYNSELYNDYLQKWTRCEFQTTAQRGLPRTEVLWMNFDTPKQITMGL